MDMLKEKHKPGDTTLHNMNKIVEFVRDFVKQHGISPTLKEITVGIGYKESNFGNIQPMVKKLLKEGFLEQVRPGYRTIRVPKKLPREVYYDPEVDG